MKTPRWLNPRALLLLHAEALAEHGGLAGLRDAAAFDSAMTRQQHIFHYESRADLPRLAAAYAFGIIQNHPFNDGNKRAGFIAADLFLHLNGYQLRCGDADAVQAFFGLASGTIKEMEFVEWIRRNSSKR